MQNRASLTAEYMALFRALESLQPANSRLFFDPFAAGFLGGRRRWLYPMARLGWARRIIERVLDDAAPGARAAGIARTRWIDDEVTAALAQSSQLVLLGAGFDTRAFRLPAARRATTFELDHPETSRAKQAALKKNGPLPDRVRFISLDFNHEAVDAVLTQAGFNKTQPACFVWEGVTNYLTAEAIDTLLRQVQQSAPGSILLFTYIDRAVLDHRERFFGAAKLMARLESYGEPWTFGYSPDDLSANLAARGFQLLANQSVADVWRQAGRPTSGTRGYEFYWLAKARVV